MQPEQTVLAESINGIIEFQNVMQIRYMSPLAEDFNAQKAWIDRFQGKKDRYRKAEYNNILGIMSK
jgi:hypothetical protein